MFAKKNKKCHLKVKMILTSRVTHLVPPLVWALVAMAMAALSAAMANLATVLSIPQVILEGENQSFLTSFSTSL